MKDVLTVIRVRGGKIQGREQIAPYISYFNDVFVELPFFQATGN